MRLRSYWLPWALAATIVVFGYGGVALAQVSIPASPPGSRQSGGEVRQGGVPEPTAPSTPSAEMLELMRKSEEQSRTHGSFTVEPPHPVKRWGTANGLPPERYHPTAPPGPVVPRGTVGGNTPCGDKSPPGHWKPCVSYPFSNHHPYHSATAPVGKPGAVGEIPQGVRRAPTAAYTPSPEEQRELERTEEQNQKYGSMTEAPPLDARRPRPFASPAPPGPVVPGGTGIVRQ